MSEFDKWNHEFRTQNLNAFNNSPKGLLWLKVRAVCRGKLLKQFLKENNILLASKRLAEQNIELYSILECRNDAECMLDRFLTCMNNEWYTALGVDIEKLKEDLYKIQNYSWGGDQNNSLDKYLISHYVKVISDYSELQVRRSEIGGNAWNYVQNSWYNNWTSFIIESLFKCNPKVISAVGEIKSVDFFIQGYPIDLKETYFPNQFMEEKIRAVLGRSPLSWLKSKCREIGISCDTTASNAQQMYELTEKLKELGKLDIIGLLENTRRDIIGASRNDPTELIRWLYENQGEMRFGAENRLYLILADSRDFAESWKMKRAFSLIEPKVKEYIDGFSGNSLRKIQFEFRKNKYSALSDALFIVK